MIEKPLVTQHEPFVSLPKLGTAVFTDDFLAEPFQLKATQACSANYNLNFSTKLVSKSLIPQTKLYFPAKILGSGYNLWFKVAEKQMKINLQLPTLKADQVTLNTYLTVSPSRKLDNLKLAACLSMLRSHSSGITQLDIRPKFNSNGFSIAHRIMATHSKWVFACSGAHNHKLQSLKEQILIGHQSQQRDLILKTEQAWLKGGQDRSLHNIYDQVVLNLILKKPDIKIGFQGRLGVLDKIVDLTALLQTKKIPHLSTCSAKAKFSISQKLALAFKKRVDKDRSFTLSGEYDFKTLDSKFGLQIDLNI